VNEIIDFQLVKLADGGRLLGFSEKAAGLCLEKRLEARQPVVRQKTPLFWEFEELLSREISAAH
jgi:hypothetical protein